MARHSPQDIVFRDGPTGRRAALEAGQDIWEIIVVMRDYEQGNARKAVRNTAKWLGLTKADVIAAQEYYARHPDEIDTRIEASEKAAR